MRIAISLLCLALVASVAFATLAPAPVQQGDKVKAESPILLPEQSPAVVESQNLFCGPYIGDCNALTFGGCDCDVPTPDYVCNDINGRNFQVFTCYGTLYCYLGALCPQ